MIEQEYEENIPVESSSRSEEGYRWDPADFSIVSILQRHGSYIRSEGAESEQFHQALELASRLPEEIRPLGEALVHNDRSLLDDPSQRSNLSRFDALTGPRRSE